ncbi:MAG: CapA family protein [Dehalococcoidia bacterium]
MWILLVALAMPASACGRAASDETTATPSVPSSEGTAAPAPTATPTPTPGPLTLVAVGDMMLARSVGQRVLSDGPEVVFGEAVAAILREADLAIGNLECAVSERGEPQPKGYTFRAPPAAVEALELAGFDMVSLANNHALDYGPDALHDTVMHLEDRGIRAVGAGPDLPAASAATILERGGLRIAFVGLVDVPPEGPGFSRDTWEAGPDSWGVAWADEETVRAAVAAAAESADIVVALLHFGFEYHTTPSAAQRTLAHTAIDAGASLVIGTHPHVLQEVEEYGGGLIAYSLGNFVFDGFDGTANDSAILRVTLEADAVLAWELVPVELVDNGLPRLQQR